jgi:hypothetical protein
MQKNSIVSITQIITLGALVLSLFSNYAAAGDLEWSGAYRFEGNFIKNSELGSKGKELTYGTQHLVLRPKIVAGDGLTIFGQFDILNDSAYPNSQMGQVWGNGVGDGTPSSSEDSSTVSQKQKAETIEVSQLYLTYNHEYGNLILGRAPLHFGLGITHNAGRGLFDHWYDTRDMAAFKFVVGNLYFMPIFGKPSENTINNSDDINDYMFNFQYENPETEIELGVLYWLRKAGQQGSDAPSSTSVGGAGATNTGEVDMKTVSVYFKRGSERFNGGLEAAFQSGETGIMTTGSEPSNVSLGGVGVAAELEYRGQDSKTKWSLKSGFASGDDPSTTAKFEGFIFDRNYDVAMLMFNRPLGQYDIFGTSLDTGAVRDADQNINRADVEAVSNTIYVAPGARYHFSDRWAWDNTVIAGWLTENPLAGSTPERNPGKELGYEFDTSLIFTPRKGVMWVNQAGFLFPGDAWKGDGQYDSKFSFGLATKAAISF